MSMSQIPPQAYTRDTLAKAYTWLLQQNDSVKSMAQSADTLVSLYLKSQRLGEENIDRPSLQSFKSELKSLAGMMGEFDEQDNTPFRVSSQQILGTKSATQTSSSPTSHVTPQAQGVSPSAQAPQTTPVDLKHLLDSRSLSMIQEVRSHLNLSYDSEALRVLISLGFEKVKGLFQK